MLHDNNNIIMQYYVFSGEILRSTKILLHILMLSYKHRQKALSGGFEKNCTPKSQMK